MKQRCIYLQTKIPTNFTVIPRIGTLTKTTVTNGLKARKVHTSVLNNVLNFTRRYLTPPLFFFVPLPLAPPLPSP